MIVATGTTADMTCALVLLCVCLVSDRRALLTGLLTESTADEKSHLAAAQPPRQEEQTVIAAAAQPIDANGAHSEETNRESSSGTEAAASANSGERSSEDSSEPAASSLAADSSEQTPAVSSPPHTVAPPPSAATAASPPPQPAAISAVSFPFFPYVISDPSCALPVASLTACLAANDSRVSSAVLDCVLGALNDALQAHTHRVYGGVAVANAPLHSDSHSQHAPAAASSWQSQGMSQSHRGEGQQSLLVGGVHDFVGPLTALSALLSLSDRLSESRVDECLSRLLVLARRVCARRPSSVCPAGSQCINGSEERFLLSFVRSVLQLAANHKPIAAWLRGHQNEWYFLETLYTQARHMTGMQLIKAG